MKLQHSVTSESPSFKNMQHLSVVPGVPESLLELLVGLKGSLRFKTFDFLEELEGVKGLLGELS